MDNAMNSKQKQQYLFLVALWSAAASLFWLWWINPSHVGNPILFTLLSLALFYDTTVLPSIYVFFLGWMKQPHIPASPLLLIAPKKLKKVAMITLTVPGSESIEIVKKQLVGLTKVTFPHDSWILVDKVHSPEIEKMAKKLGVKYFCRADAAKWGEAKVQYWNQDVPPFKTKTKAGNVNAWIDAYGDAYSHFTQLDIDHIPVPNYLDRVLGYFIDSDVAWVQAPSVYGNLEYWTARGSAEQELVLHGPLQSGFYGFSDTPFIIGSHSTYDMDAIKAIGGFQPTRAEDHLDTVYLAAHGKKGIFVPDVIAIGDGPETFETYLSQQFAWAYSMIQVLFNFTPKMLRKYSLKQGLQFLFVQTWYPVWALSMFILFAAPLISLVTDSPISVVSYWEFMAYSIPLGLVSWGIWMWSHRWHKPEKLGLSWRGVVLHVARWVVVLSALVQVIFKVKKPYMITTKGMQTGKDQPFNLMAHAWYFALIFISLAACWMYIWRTGSSATQGYLLFALEGAAILLLIFMTVLAKDIHELSIKGASILRIVKIRFQPLLVLFATLAVFAWTTAISSEKIEAAIFYSPTPTPVRERMVSPTSESTPTPTLAPTPFPSPTPNITHTVKEGESLWRIAKKYYGKGSDWKKLATHNNDTIQPGEVVEIR